MSRTHVLLGLALALFCAPELHAQRKFSDPPAVVPHAEFAEAFRAARGLLGKEPEDIDLEALIEAEYARIDLGLYDVRFPIEDLSERESAEDLRDLALALLRAQEEFARWMGLEKERVVKTDLRAIRSWVEGWSPKELERAAAEHPADLAKGLGIPEPAAEALARFNEWMRLGRPVELSRSTQLSSRILFMPTRPRFLQFVCFAGWYYPHLRSVFWDDGLGTWLGCRVQETQVMALQYASPDISEADFELGLPLDYKYPDVLEQHAIHFATQALFDNYFGDSLPGFATTGLAMNLVLDLYDQLYTRIEGDLRARYSEAFSVFVPGGASGGGSLPPYDPDGRWRKEKGKGHFLKLLARAQKEGNDYVRNSREKNLRFEILHDDERQKLSMTAPFLGTPSKDKELPERAYLGDYQEFFRAYKCAFAHWLQTEGAGSRSRSEARFAELLQQLGRSLSTDFEALVQELYGVPLSEEVPGKRSLEGRFLLWLTKQ